MTFALAAAYLLGLSEYPELVYSMNKKKNIIRHNIIVPRINSSLINSRMVLDMAPAQHISNLYNLSIICDNHSLTIPVLPLSFSRPQTILLAGKKSVWIDRFWTPPQQW